MAIYFFLLFLSLVLWYPLQLVWGARAKSRYMFIMFCALFLVMSLRSVGVGIDTIHYGRYFYQISYLKRWELISAIVPNAPIYCAWNKLVSLLGGNYRAFLIVTSFIILHAAFLFIHDFSENVVLSVFCYIALFFYLHAYNITRQFLALSAFLYALHFRKEDKPLYSLALSALSVGLHSTAAISLPILLIYPVGNRPTYAILYKYLKILIFIVAPPFQIWFRLLIQIFIYIFPRYAGYVNGIYKHSVFEQSSGSVILLNLFYTLVSLFALATHEGLVPGLRVERKSLNLFRYCSLVCFFGGIFGIVGGTYEALTRALYFYDIFFICLIPNVVMKFKASDSYRRYYPLAFYFILLLLTFCFAVTLIKNLGEVVPYRAL